MCILCGFKMKPFLLDLVNLKHFQGFSQIISFGDPLLIISMNMNKKTSIEEEARLSLDQLYY